MPGKPTFIPPEARAAVLAGHGVDDTAAAALLGMHEGIAGGRFTRNDAIEQLRGDVPLAASVKRIAAALQAA